ncbi:hypothetical protein GPB2148_2595 [marine gamma proteobacterium HTCC2148]|nr:hypothetical protein GPB2148_2595 [marine gamma proteobacterium HTCC2148]
MGSVYFAYTYPYFLDFLCFLVHAWACLCWCIDRSLGVPV